MYLGLGVVNRGMQPWLGTVIMRSAVLTNMYRTAPGSLCCAANGVPCPLPGTVVQGPSQGRTAWGACRASPGAVALGLIGGVALPSNLCEAGGSLWGEA